MIRCVILICCVCIAVPAAATEIASFVSDVDQLMADLERTHPNIYSKHSPEEWTRAADSLKVQLPAMEFHEAILGFVRLVNMLNDGHSRVLLPNSTAFTKRFPIYMRVFADGVYVRTALRSAGELFGKRIVAIEGVPIDEVFRRVRPYVAHENDMGFLDLAPLIARLPSVLHVTGVTSSLVDTAMLTIEDDDGERSEYVVRALRRDVFTDNEAQREEWVDVDTFLGVETAKPRYRSAVRNYSMEYLEAEKLLYVNFQSVRNEPEESFRRFSERVFEFVDDHDVERFVLDIRENGGGNNYLNQPMVHGLIASARLRARGRVFVIVGRDTFSAAMGLAVDIERNTHAIFVGEPTGGRPNSFGDATQFVLNKSGLRIRCSTLYWQMSDPRDQRPWITPEVTVDYTFKSFLEHRDPALEAILNFGGIPTGIDEQGPNTRWMRDGH